MIFDFFVMIYSILGITLIFFSFLFSNFNNNIKFIIFFLSGSAILYSSHYMAKAEYENLINFKSKIEVVYVDDKIKGDPYDSKIN